MRVAAIVVAGGVGSRLKSRQHKPFVPLCGRPILVWTLRAFARARPIDEVILVVHDSDVAKAKALVRQHRINKVTRVVRGGATRLASVSCGLRALAPDPRWVVVHDGARPLVTPQIIEETLRAARASGAAIAAIPIVPTVKEVREDWVVRTLDRNHLWAVQTPQAFRRDLLERAHAKARARGITATDDAALVEALGCRVRIVMGSPRNIKVTTPEDLVIAKALLKGRPSSMVNHRSTKDDRRYENRNRV